MSTVFFKKQEVFCFLRDVQRSRTSTENSFMPSETTNIKQRHTDEADPLFLFLFLKAKTGGADLFLRYGKTDCFAAKNIDITREKMYN